MIVKTQYIYLRIHHVPIELLKLQTEVKSQSEILYCEMQYCRLDKNHRPKIQVWFDFSRLILSW